MDFKNQTVYFGGFEFGSKSSFGIEIRNTDIYIGFWSGGKPQGVGAVFQKKSMVIENLS